MDFRQTAEQSRDAVQDGGESLLTVATQVPVPQIACYRDSATGAGYLATGVAFRDVGTSLRVQAASRQATRSECG